MRAEIHKLRIIRVEDIWSKFNKGDRADRLVNGWYRSVMERKEINSIDMIDKDQ